MENVSEVIDWILRLTGIISILYFIFSLIIPKKEFSSNIKITRVLNTEEIHDFDKYIYFDDPGTKGEHILFEPQDCIFKKVKLYSVRFTKFGIRKDKCIKVFRNISPVNGLIINSYYPCGCPSRLICWYGENGITGEYLLAENGKTGNVDLLHYIYQFGLFQNIKRLFSI